MTIKSLSNFKVVSKFSTLRYNWLVKFSQLQVKSESHGASLCHCLSLQSLRMTPDLPLQQHNMLTREDQTMKIKKIVQLLDLPCFDRPVKNTIPLHKSTLVYLVLVIMQDVIDVLD